MKENIVLIPLLLSIMLGAIGLPSSEGENYNTDEIGITSVLRNPAEYDMNWIGWVFDEVENKWCTDFPAVPVNDTLVWKTKIADTHEAYLTFKHEYDFETYPDYEAMGYVELSADDGDTWSVLGVYKGNSDDHLQESFDISYWVGNDILIRFRAFGKWYYGNGYDGGHWCVWDLLNTGKENTSGPTTEIMLTKDAEYKSPVHVRITATDVGAGMGWIHYILDGKETVVEGEVATFTITSNGMHILEFWGVDKTGNEEIPHNTAPIIRIDVGGLRVRITAPEPGLYLFGNKLLSHSKVFIIGAFFIEADAYGAEDYHQIYKFVFYIDDDLISEDTEAPFGSYCAQKHMGAGTLKVVGIDFSMNIAEDTLDLIYYKLR